MLSPTAPLRAFAIATILGLSLFGQRAWAQTLPQSTIDRQQIMQLQSELSNPSITPSQRREIEMQISTLEYRINTRPLIVPPPNLSKGAPPTPSPYLVRPAGPMLGRPGADTAPSIQDACSVRAALTARLHAMERNAPLSAQRAYAREALQRLSTVPC